MLAACLRIIGKTSKLVQRGMRVHGDYNQKEFNDPPVFLINVRVPLRDTQRGCILIKQSQRFVYVFVSRYALPPRFHMCMKVRQLIQSQSSQSRFAYRLHQVQLLDWKHTDSNAVLKLSAL